MLYICSYKSVSILIRLHELLKHPEDLQQYATYIMLLLYYYKLYKLLGTFLGMIYFPVSARVETTAVHLNLCFCTRSVTSTANKLCQTI